jgi:hypothetical protein
MSIYLRVSSGNFFNLMFHMILRLKYCSPNSINRLMSVMELVLLLVTNGCNLYHSLRLPLKYRRILWRVARDIPPGISSRIAPLANDPQQVHVPLNLVPAVPASLNHLGRWCTPEAGDLFEDWSYSLTTEIQKFHIQFFFRTFMPSCIQWEVNILIWCYFICSVNLIPVWMVQS